MAHVVDINSKNPLLGTWKSCDDFSDVHISIDLDRGELRVRAVDTHDGEVAEIHDIAWVKDQGELTFSAYWKSSGRFTKYRFGTPGSNGRISVTYTFTAQETWEKA